MVGNHEGFNPQLTTPTNWFVKTQQSSLTKSFYFAYSGLIFAVRTQRNMKIHLLSALAVSLFMMIFPLALSIRLALIGCIALVFAAELLNTALEAVVDLCSPGFHTLAKRAKDCAAAAVLAAAIFSLIVFVYALMPLWKETISLRTWLNLVLAAPIIIDESFRLFRPTTPKINLLRSLLSGSCLLILSFDSTEIIGAIISTLLLMLSSAASKATSTQLP